MHDKAAIRLAKLHMRKVLLELWDPIGVLDEPFAQDEYDGYLGCLYMLLARRAPVSEIVDRLREIETVDMGLHGQPESALMAVADALKKISI